jgi:hypothetical protein
MLLGTLAIAGLVVLLLAPVASAQDPCVVADNGTGTVTLPPIGCDYLSPDEVHVIIDGLPAGTTIELAPIHKDFICNEQPGGGGISCGLIPPGLCEAPGGDLGGNVDCFQSTLEMQATGTGTLAGFNRILLFQQSFTEIHTGPRNAGDSVQDFDTEMVSMQAQLFGDPDFDFLTITAGSANGLPSPGHTTLTDLGDGTFNVDSFFDITYQIDFQGAPGSNLEGFGGSTQSGLTMGAGIPAGSNPCEAADNGTGTVTLPPAGCEYLSPDDVHMIMDGLPPDTTIELAAIHKDFICRGQQQTCSVPLGVSCEVPGGGLGGNIDCFDSTAELDVSGTGALGSFQRTLFIPLAVEVHSAPRTPGDPIQDFDTEMVALQGQLFGDPDFDLLVITAGSDHGLPPSPGHTTLTDNGNGTFAVDSFFDIAYRIDFQGAPGGQLDGLSGGTTGTITMGTGEPPPIIPGLTAPIWVLIGGLVISGAAMMVLRRREEAR